MMAECMGRHHSAWYYGQPLGIRGGGWGAGKGDESERLGTLNGTVTAAGQVRTRLLGCWGPGCVTRFVKMWLALHLPSSSAVPHGALLPRRALFACACALLWVHRCLAVCVIGLVYQLRYYFSWKVVEAGYVFSGLDFVGWDSTTNKPIWWVFGV